MNNPNIGKGWTDAEEVTFTSIMRVGHLTRIKAIQLFKRCSSSATKALRLAAEYDAAARASASVNAARTANLKRFREGHFPVQKAAALGANTTGQQSDSLGV